MPDKSIGNPRDSSAVSAGCGGPVPGMAAAVAVAAAPAVTWVFVRICADRPVHGVLASLQP